MAYCNFILSLSAVKLILFFGCLFSNAIAEEDLVRATEEARGLRFKTRPVSTTLDDAKFRAKLITYFQSEVPPSRASHEEVVFKMLRFIPKDYEYSRCLYENAGKYALGFYDYRFKVLYLRKGFENSPHVVSHELIHALQDQHFDLRRLNIDLNESTNRGLAIASLLEGDATVHQLSGKTENFSPQPDECSAPAPLENLFMIPYEFGQVYVKRFGSVDGLLMSSIMSSNFLISGVDHPQPKAVWNAHYFQDSLGPLFYRELFQIHNKTSNSIIATKGIIFDIIKLYKSRLQAQVKFSSERSRDFFWNSLLHHYSNEFKTNISPVASRFSLVNNDTKFSAVKRDLTIKFTIESD